MELTKAVIFFIGFLVAVCMGLPAPSIKDEVESVKPVKTYGDQPIVDTGYFSGWDSPFSENPFGGLFDSLESVMERMRQQIASIISKFPGKGANSTDELPTFPGFNGVDLPPFPNIGDIDLSKGNTTSVTKIVDGHKVVINETEYKNEDDFGGTFFKVRIIDVKPDSSELTTEKEPEAIPDNSTPKPKDREEVENSLENEIPKSNEAENLASTESHDNISLYDNIEEESTRQFDNIETFDEVDSREKSGIMSSASSGHNQRYSPIDNEERFPSNKNAEWLEDDDVPKTLDTEWSKVSPVESIETNSIETEDNFKEHAGQPPFDLSRDTYVNEILAKNGAPVNPDAEVFYVAQTSPSPIEGVIAPR